MRADMVKELLRGLEYLEINKVQMEKDLLYELEDNFEPKFILDIAYNKGLSIEEKLEIFSKGE